MIHNLRRLSLVQTIPSPEIRPAKPCHDSTVPLPGDVHPRLISNAMSSVLSWSKVDLAEFQSKVSMFSGRRQTRSRSFNTVKVCVSPFEVNLPTYFSTGFPVIHHSAIFSLILSSLMPLLRHILELRHFHWETCRGMQLSLHVSKIGGLPLLGRPKGMGTLTSFR